MMETSDPNYSNNTTKPLLVSTVLSTNVLHAKNPHGTEASKDKLRRCKKCRKTFKNYGTYISHIKFHNVKIRKPSNKHQIHDVLFQQQEFHCKTCEATCTGVSAFLDHVKSHSEEQEASYSALQSHQQEIDVGDSAIQIPSITDDANTAESSQQVLEEHAMSLEQNGQLSADTLQHISSYNTANLSTNTHGMNMQMQPNVNQGVNFQGNNNNTGMHIEIPSHIRSLSFNSNTGAIPQLDAVMKTLTSLHNKIDIVMKHLNIALDEDGNLLPPAATSMEVNEANEANHSSQNTEGDQDKGLDSNDGETVLLEGFPPSYSIVQAAKEQQQQEFYALTLSNRQTQQLTPTSNDMKLLKGKGIDLWVPTSHQYILAEAQPDEDTTELTIPITASATIPSMALPSSIVDKIFVESRSRANFAKNLTFAIFTQEERRGKNCTGRVFGKAQHKGQLEPVKLQAVKEATFRKYPCSPNLIDITWRKECITAIDSGLRNEHRSTSLKHSVGGGNEGEGSHSPHHHHHHHQLVVDNSVSPDLKQEALNEQQNTMIGS